VGLTVIAPPSLAISPASLTINATTGTVSQPFIIGNSGGVSLNWTANLDVTSPAFVSLSAGAGSNLAGGSNATVNLIVNATGVAGGNTYQANVTIGAIDSVTGHPVRGSSLTLPVAINIAAPSMQVSTTNLIYNATAGEGDPVAQAIVITNMGGNTLKWKARAPSQHWLSVSQLKDSDLSMATSTVTFSVNITSMGAGSYAAIVIITPSVGSPITVTASLTINGPGPPTPTLGTTPTPTPFPVTPTPTAKPEPTATPRRR